MNMVLVLKGLQTYLTNKAIRYETHHGLPGNNYCLYILGL